MQSIEEWKEATLARIEDMPLREKVKAASKFFTECALLGKVGGAVVETIILPAQFEIAVARLAVQDIIANPQRALSQEVCNVLVSTIDKDPAVVNAVIKFAQTDAEFLVASGESTAQRISTFVDRMENNGKYYVTLKTGEKCRIMYPNDIIKRELEWAPKKYAEIRALVDDVQKIAKNTGMPEVKIQRIKNHLYNDKHILKDGFRCFDADSEIAAAWDRLYNGDFVHNDIQLLQHEYFESKFECLFKTDYEKAHAAAQQKAQWYPNE